MKRQQDMNQDDTGLELMLGRLLQTGVIVAALIVASGGLFLLISRGMWIPDFGVFHGAKAEMRTLTGVLDQAFGLSPEGIVQMGVLVLIATPVLRVAFSLLGFARQRDWLYVVLTLVVLCVLTAGLSGWAR